MDRSFALACCRADPAAALDTSPRSMRPLFVSSVFTLLVPDSHHNVRSKTHAVHHSQQTPATICKPSNQSALWKGCRQLCFFMDSRLSTYRAAHLKSVW